VKQSFHEMTAVSSHYVKWLVSHIDCNICRPITYTFDIAAGIDWSAAAADGTISC